MASKVALNYQKVNAIDQGVLVCIDKEKDIYKYVPLENVSYQGQKLGTVLKETNEKIKALIEWKKETIEWQKNVANLLNIKFNESEDL